MTEGRDTGETASCFTDGGGGVRWVVNFNGGRWEGGGREVRGGWCSVIKVVEVVEVCGDGRWWLLR
jgi:hypothetical protein